MEQTILRCLLSNDEYVRRALPFIKEEYFTEQTDILLFRLIREHIDSYSSLPTKESLGVALQALENIGETLFQETCELIDSLDTSPVDVDWAIDKTESFCQDRALYNAIKKSIEIVDGNDGATGLAVGALPELMTDALGVCFDPKIGHEYVGGEDERYADLHFNAKKMPFDIGYLNTITNGGVETKSLNIILAGTNVGKTMFMCHDAATKLAQGGNVLYCTYEMPETKIGWRIDANLAGIPLDDFLTMSQERYKKVMEGVYRNVKGRLIIKEYPAAVTHVGHLRHLLGDLKLKAGFSPDVIYIDYINLLVSSRMKYGNSVNTYMMIKAIAEELHGLAKEYDVPIWSGTQTNRGGQSSSELELEDTAESFGLPQTCDLMLGFAAPDDMVELGQILVKQLKNRYRNKYKNNKGVIGVDYERARFHDVEDDAQLADYHSTSQPHFDSPERLSDEQRQKFDAFR